MSYVPQVRARMRAVLQRRGRLQRVVGEIGDADRPNIADPHHRTPLITRALRRDDECVNTHANSERDRIIFEERENPERKADDSSERITM